jgi:hypothetical protein
VSVLESIRRVQDAESEAEAILASARARAGEELARSRREAATLVEAAAAAVREGLERLRELSREEEAAAVAGLEEAAIAEMADIRARAERNRTAATAVLTDLVGRLAGREG